MTLCEHKYTKHLSIDSPFQMQTESLFFIAKNFQCSIKFTLQWQGGKGAAFCMPKPLSVLNLLTELTTFSRGAAPKTLNTGLGLEGEMHSTMACWPTLVVYSSRVARSFLKTHTHTRQSVSSRSGWNVFSCNINDVCGRTGITQWC